LESPIAKQAPIPPSPCAAAIPVHLAQPISPMTPADCASSSSGSPTESPGLEGGRDWPSVGQRIIEWSDALAAFSEDETALTRTYLTSAHHAAAEQIRHWMQAAGMQVRRDAVGNIIGRYEGSRPGAPALLTGSHFDSVRNAGKYDGTLGVLLPIAVIALLNDSGRRLECALEVIGFAEEEGVRFKSTLLGSRALAGTFDPAVLASRDQAGCTLGQAIDAAGLGFGVADIPAAAYAREKVLGFLEVHIEQGPVLLNADLPVGIVTAIAGASRYVLELTGEAGHAGTVPMAMRRDAAMAACVMALELETYCRARAQLVGTVGQLEIPHGTANVVPGKARFSIDIRSSDDTVRAKAVADTLAMAKRVAEERGIELAITPTHEAQSVPCSKALQERLEHAIKAQGLPVHYLPSGAGHDAMAMAKLTDVAMLFVRCGNGGISHNPKEALTAADAGVAASVFMRFLEGWGEPKAV
jgi:hydantoinase/carbamoylase family amidase